MTNCTAHLGTRSSTVVLVCALALAAFTSSFAQTTATISGSDTDVATAGDKLTYHLTFDTAASCDHGILIYLIDASGRQEIGLNGSLMTGKTEADVTGAIPKDYAGAFTSTLPSYPLPALQPCSGYSTSKSISMPPIKLNVKGIPDPNTHPEKAQVAPTQTQAQLLDTKIARLSALSGQIDTRVDADGRDTRELRDFLAALIKRAEAELTLTEKEFRTQFLKSDEQSPPFFADLYKQYENVRTELSAPIPGTQAGLAEPAHLIYVQQTLKRRSSAQVRSGNLSGSSPGVANNTKSALEDNEGAYKAVGAQGSHPMFHATFESFPSGARLFYRQAIMPDFSEWSKPTKIDGADFPLARFVFKLHSDECDDDQVRTIDPYVDTSPDISVEFRKCRRR